MVHLRPDIRGEATPRRIPPRTGQNHPFINLLQTLAQVGSMPRRLPTPYPTMTPEKWAAYYHEAAAQAVADAASEAAADEMMQVQAHAAAEGQVQVHAAAQAHAEGHAAAGAEVGVVELDAEPVFVSMTGQELCQRMAEHPAAKEQLKEADRLFVRQLTRSSGFLQEQSEAEVKIQRGRTARGNPAPASGSGAAPMENNMPRDGNAAADGIRHARRQFGGQM